VRNDDYPASLELRKLYPVLEDEFAAEHGLIDESGEDYLYPGEFFVYQPTESHFDQIFPR
jgi:hypothetical protein